MVERDSKSQGVNASEIFKEMKIGRFTIYEILNT